MVFRVTFEPFETVVARVKDRTLGHRYVQPLIDSGVDADKINNTIEDFRKWTCEIEVPYATARGLEAFREDGEIRVIVPSRSFNRFLKFEPVEHDGEWHFECDIDNDAVLAAWIAAGCPERWDLSQE